MVDGKVIFRTGEMRGRDQPEEALIGLFESGVAGKQLPLFGLNKTISLGISLLD